ncbi:MAG: hypothetical protein RR382_00495 [Tannerellaceae bacterium]
MILKNALRIDKGYDFNVQYPGTGTQRAVGTHRTINTLECIMLDDRNLRWTWAFNYGALHAGYAKGVAYGGYDVWSLFNQNTRTQMAVLISGDVESYYINRSYRGYIPCKLTDPASPVTIDRALTKLYALRIYNRVLTQEELARNYELDRVRYDLEEQNHIQTGPEARVNVELPPVWPDAGWSFSHTSETQWITIDGHSVNIEANTTGAIRRGVVKIVATDNVGAEKSTQYMTIRQSA